jgi:hypothetical protein
MSNKPQPLNYRNANQFSVLFTGLKLTGYIDWSWWWVLAPLWGGMLITWFVLMCQNGENK